MDDREQWLSLLAGEIAPKVAASRRPDAVLLKPWVDSAVTAVELRIEQHRYGAAITVLAYGDVPQLPDETLRTLHPERFARADTCARVPVRGECRCAGRRLPAAASSRIGEALNEPVLLLFRQTAP